MKEHQTIQEFLGRNIDVLSNPDFGSKNFNEIKDRFREIREMIVEMVEIAENTKIPSGLINQVYQFAGTWNSFHKQIETYNLDSDGRSEFRTRQNLINGIIQWYDSCMIGYDSQQSNRPNNFLSVYNSIKNFNLKDVETERKKVADLVSDFQTKKIAVDSITEEFRKKSGEQTLSDYSIIFHNESERHSCFKVNRKDIFKIGAAEIWLVLGVGLSALFCYFLVSGKMNQVLGTITTGDSGVVLINVLTRLIIISIWVYLISFCFKQYSVNKHLATLNRHRSNTLNSFKLFIESIDPSDSVTKNALMLEVAKAIYEQGMTGHLSGKGADNSPSIIELTRFVNQTKQ
ncbi:MAG: hypothetical protein KF846_09070 [Cyclobacteriaceae bacterium]|nr:hypothetical protein [Cyclobacteriaceae bacterium]